MLVGGSPVFHILEFLHHILPPSPSNEEIVDRQASLERTVHVLLELGHLIRVLALFVEKNLKNQKDGPWSNCNWKYVFECANLVAFEAPFDVEPDQVFDVGLHVWVEPNCLPHVLVNHVLVQLLCVVADLHSTVDYKYNFVYFVVLSLNDVPAVVIVGLENFENGHHEQLGLSIAVFSEGLSDRGAFISHARPSEDLSSLELYQRRFLKIIVVRFKKKFEKKVRVNRTLDSFWKLVQ